MESVTVTEDDIQKIAKINTGIGATIGKFSAALVLKHQKLFGLRRYIKRWRRSMDMNWKYLIALNRDFSDGPAIINLSHVRLKPVFLVELDTKLKAGPGKESIIKIGWSHIDNVGNSRHDLESC